MVMLIDAGNSRIKWCRFNPYESHTDVTEVMSENYPKGGISAKNKSTKADTVKVLLSQEKPAKMRMVHVLGELFEREVKAFCLEHEIEFAFVSTHTASYCGVTNGYSLPAQLGADRFVALIGAYHLYPESERIIVDAGTAVTIDALARNGQHLGGVILPGLQLCSDTLIKNTVLPNISKVNDIDVFATNTTTGIKSGSLYGLSGAIHHICDIMERKRAAELKSNSCQRIVCGGDSQQLAGYLQTYNASEKYAVIPDLVMYGLRIIERNNA